MGGNYAQMQQQNRQGTRAPLPSGGTGTWEGDAAASFLANNSGSVNTPSTGITVIPFNPQAQQAPGFTYQQFVDAQKDNLGQSLAALDDAFSKYGGVASYTPTIAKPITRELDESKETLSGRLEGLIDSESTLMKRAKTQGQREAASRGLINSTMAGEAAQGALIDRAAPIAAADADAFRGQQQINQQIENEAERARAQALTAASASAAAATNASNANKLQAVSNLVGQIAGGQTQGALTALEGSLRQELQGSINAGNISTQLISDINRIAGDPSLSQAQIQSGINLAIDTAAPFISAVGGANSVMNGLGLPPAPSGSNNGGRTLDTVSTQLRANASANNLNLGSDGLVYNSVGRPVLGFTSSGTPIY